MDNVILARLSRVILRTISLIIGSLGLFCCFWSCMGLRTAAHAIVCNPSSKAASVCLPCPGVDQRPRFNVEHKLACWPPPGHLAFNTLRQIIWKASPLPLALRYLTHDNV